MFYTLRMALRISWVLGLLSLICVSAFADSSVHFKKTMVIVLENINYSDAIQQPFLGQFAKQGALLENFYAETHPSQPNYIAFVSGSTQGVASDANVNLDASHIGDLLEAKGMKWKVYAEQYPGNCFLGARSSNYVRKHIPFLSFMNVQSNPKRCGNIVDASVLSEDLSSGTIPEFSLYIPDIKNDGHDTGVAYADSWLASKFGPLLRDPKLMKDMLLVITFDESENSGGNRIYTALYGDGIAPGTVVKQKYDHYSLLRTIEDEFGLGTLGRNDTKASPITGIWKALNQSLLPDLTASPVIEVVQTVPLETTLAVSGIRQTQEVWLEMLRAATKTIDLEQFYVSDQAGEALVPVLEAITQAAKRGVHIRLLADKKFYSTYPDSVNQIGQLPNAEARLADFSAQGGVQHAKFFILDGKQSFVGSQNFDWRALSHIHEVGVRATDPKVNADLQAVFERDWGPAITVTGGNNGGKNSLTEVTDATALPAIYVAASPRQVNPGGIPDSLTVITNLIDSAQKNVRIQVMEYSTKSSDKGSKPWTALDDVIRKAASRGVQVQLLVDVSNIQKAKGDLVSLAALKNVEVRTVTIPNWSGGSIPYARLIHSKYLTVDGAASWVGTENWSQGYFMNTRDVGFVIHSLDATGQLNKIFDQVWNSPYSTKM